MRKKNFRFPKGNPSWNEEKINKKIALLEKSSTKRTSSKSSVYHDEYGSYDCPKNGLAIKPLKKIKNKNKQNAYLENLTKKKMRTRSSVYYDGYSSYDCRKNFLPIKPLKEVKKNII